MKTLANGLGLCLLGVGVLGTGGWAALALLYSGPQHEALRQVMAVGGALAAVMTVWLMFFRRRRWFALVAYTGIFALLLGWWSTVAPSNDREWQTDVAVLPYATFDGDSVTVHNVRNFDYRSETDYTPAYYDKRYALSELQGVDIIAVYWMGPAIAHVFLSFDFGADNHLAVSIETRKEKNEGYSTIKGFFRQYELFYVVADERDVIRLRTNYRHNPPEDVYVYRLKGDIEDGRRLFVEYMQRINALKNQPEFYNTLTTNCTTSIWLNAHVNPHHVPLHWKILASGYVPEFLYEEGRLDAEGLRFDALRQRAHINARAQAADTAIDFSRRIRERDAAQGEGSQ